MGACKEILNITSARPGLSWGGFSLAHALLLHAIAPPLVGPPVTRRRHFAPTSNRADKPQKQSRRKGRLKARRASLPSGSVPIFPHHKTPYRGPRRATQGIKQPRPTPPGASRGIIIYCEPVRAPRSALYRHPTRRIYSCCIPPRLYSLMFQVPPPELIAAHGVLRGIVDSRFPSLDFHP